MSNEVWKDTFEEQKVTYVLERQGKVFIIENGPARVCRETGERLFAPETVERLQHIIWEQRTPIRIIETPVFEFVAQSMSKAMEVQCCILQQPLHRTKACRRGRTACAARPLLAAADAGHSASGRQPSVTRTPGRAYP
jgi:YgiT-type zinc finger domain-containing protein